MFPVTRHSVIASAAHRRGPPEDGAHRNKKDVRRARHGAGGGMHDQTVFAMVMGAVLGVAIGLGLGYLVTLGNPTSYFWKIMLPGGLVGLLVGYTTYTHAEPRRPVTA